MKKLLKKKVCPLFHGNFRLGNRGMISVEASVVVPFVLLIVSMMFLLNYYFLAKLKDYESVSRDAKPSYSDIHRASSAIFDTGGAVYELLFG